MRCDENAGGDSEEFGQIVGFMIGFELLVDVVELTGCPGRVLVLLSLRIKTLYER